MTDETFTIPVGGDVEAGTYLCTLVGWEPFTAEFEGEARELIRWQFVTEDDLQIEGVSSRATGPRSKLRAWCTGLGFDVRTVKSIGAGQLVGRSALVTVVLNADGYAKVDAVVPAPKARQAK